MRNLVALLPLGLMAAVCAACARAPQLGADPVRASTSAESPRAGRATHATIDSAALRSRISADAGWTAARVHTLGDLLALDSFDDSILTDLVGTAIERNRDVLLARARVDEVRALAGVAGAPRLPSASFNTGIGANRTVLGQSALEYDAWRTTVDAVWEPDVWGRIRNGRTAAAADLAAEEAATRTVALSLTADVAVRYLQLLELDEEYEIAVRTCASRRAMLVLAQERFAGGIVSEVDVRRFEAQLAVPTARVAQVAGQRSQQEHALNVLLGEAPTRTRARGSLSSLQTSFAIPDSLPTVADRWSCGRDRG